MCQILTPLVKKMEGGDYIESTEELLSYVKEMNERLKREGEMREDQTVAVKGRLGGG